MADFSTIKAKVKAKVVGLSSYFDSSSVFDYEPDIGEVHADPWATVITSGNENDFASTGDNKRTYAFNIRVFVKRGSTRTKSEAETLLQSIIDDLIDAFDQDFTLGSTVLISRAVPSRWGYVDAVDEYRTAEVNVRAQTWFDIT